MTPKKVRDVLRPFLKRARGAASDAVYDYLMKPARARTSRAPYGPAELKLLRTALLSQNLCSVDGQLVRQFERAFAEAHDMPYAVASTSGTAAIHVALGALDLNPGAEVITTPITDLGTIIPIIQQNAIPVFGDVDASFNLDPIDLERKITPRTKAIIAVHLFGNPCDMDALIAVARRHRLALIEDCSQAHFAEYRGRLVGTLGELGCFSFQQSKLMTTGDGGMTMTANRAFAERMKLFVDKGWARKGFGPRAYLFHAPNYRMTELVGAVGLAQLAKLREVVDKRRELAARLTERLASVEGISPLPVTPGARSSYWVYGATISDGNAAALAEQMRPHKVWASGGYIGKPIYLCSESLAAKKTFGTSQWPFTCHEPEVTYEYGPGLCPQAEQGLDRLLTLPLDESWTPQRVQHAADVVARCLEGRGRTSRASLTVAAPATRAVATPATPAVATPPTATRIRVAVIGCGQMGRSHVGAYQRNPHVELVAFADTSRMAAERLAAMTGGRAYASHRELLSAERLDAVSVCSVPTSHCDIVVDALDADVHVLCEKPLATVPADAQRMAAAAARRSRVLLPAFKFRFFDEVREVKALVDRGALGSIVSARLMFGCDLDMSGTWFADPARAGGGIVMDNGSHAFDLIEHVLGPIAAISATSANCRPLAVEDCAQIRCTLRRGGTATLDLTWAVSAPPTAYLEIYGHQGTAILDPSGLTYKLAGWSDWKRKANATDIKGTFARQIDHFVDAVRGAGTPVLSADAGVRAQQLIQAAYDSIKSGGTTISVRDADTLVLVGAVSAAGG
ncbi:MAG TPA: DegT/DnrJ/EryC1/StrS family aminotransferase [Vicinamibacterales bacterium]|nr:DegT/DnrJ/EryC1/StrS family aminotransferase [Vicinamibacterales bacterium]